MDFRTLSGAISAIMSRARFSADGKMYDGDRDLYQVCGYPTLITAEMYRSRYMRNPIAARVVEAKPQDTWRGGFELIEDPDNLDKETAFEQAWRELNERLDITTWMQRADVLAGIGHYAVLVIGAPGKLEEPLKSLAAEDVLYLSAFAEDEATIKTLDEDSESPRFGQPVTYELKRAQIRKPNAVAPVAMGKQAHWSRVIHIADGLLDDKVMGTPRLERIWNRLIDLDKVTGGGSEAFWMRADGGLQLDLDPTLNLSDEEVTKLQAQIDDYRHKMTRVLRTRGLTVNRLGSDVADLKGPATTILEQISAGVGIPMRVLMGSEQGKLAAEQDAVKYYRMIEARRADFALPMVIRPFVRRLLDLGALPEPVQPYDVSWSQLKTLDDDERATLATKWAGLNSAAGETIVTSDEIRELLGKDPLDDAQKQPAPTDARSRRNPAQWADVHRAADKHLGAFKRVLRAAFRAGHRELDGLEEALELRDTNGVLVMANAAVLAVEKALKEPVKELLLDVMKVSGDAAAKRLEKTLELRAASRLRTLDTTIDMKFDVTNPKAVEWARDRAAELVSGVTKRTREQIREEVEAAFVEQFDVDELADRIEDIVGDEARAEVIARTETMKASNEGQQQLWDQAVEQGLLTGAEKKEWITTPDDRLCPVCEPLDGVTANMSDDFDVDGDQVDGPPAHPNCRCTLGLAP